MGTSRSLVLVVDDDPIIREVLEAVLADERYDVVVVHGGTEALAVARDRAPAVVVLDLMMPGMNGFELCRELRTDPRTAGARIVMLTAMDDVAYRKAAAEAGADAFFAKPFSPLELIDAVTSALDGAA